MSTSEDGWILDPGDAVSIEDQVALVAGLAAGWRRRMESKLMENGAEQQERHKVQR